MHKLIGKFGITRSSRVPASPGVKLEKFDADEVEGDWHIRDLVRGLMWSSNLYNVRIFQT